MRILYVVFLSMCLLGCAQTKSPIDRRTELTYGPYNIEKINENLYIMQDCSGGFIRPDLTAVAVDFLVRANARIEVTGHAASACTMFLDHLEAAAPSLVCVHPTAMLIFHTSSNLDENLNPLPSTETNFQNSIAAYARPQMREWFRQHGRTFDPQEAVLMLYGEATDFFGSC